jgi:hypothetical protein
MPGRGLIYTEDESNPYGGFGWSIDPSFDPYAYRTDPNAPPILADFYNKWNQSHLDQYGIPYNRPWGKHGETGLRDQFVNQYTDALKEYNNLYGTNYTPNQDSIDAFSSAPTGYAAADYSSQKKRSGFGGFFSGLVDFLGPILPIGLAAFGMPWLAPMIGTVGAGAVLGATGSALTGGDGSDILKGAVLGGLGGGASGIGAGVGEALTGSTVSAGTAAAIGNATVSGARTLIQGGDLSDVLSNAVTSGLASTAGSYAGDFVGKTLGDSLGSPVATNVLQNAAKAAASAAVRGGDIGEAALMGGIRTAAGAGWDALKNADFGTPDNSGGADDSGYGDGGDGSDGIDDWVSGEELPTGDYNQPAEPVPDQWYASDQDDRDMAGQWHPGDQDDQDMGANVVVPPTDWVSGEELPTGNYNLPDGALPPGGTRAPSIRPGVGSSSRPPTTPTTSTTPPTTAPQTTSPQGPSFDMLMRLASAASTPQVNVQAPALAMIPGWNAVSTPYGGPSLFASGGSVPDMYAINQELLKMVRG